MAKKLRNDLEGIKPINNAATQKEKKRKVIEIVVGVVLLVLIITGGIILLAQNNESEPRVAGASTENEEALKAEIDNLNKKIDELNNKIDTAQSVVTETSTSETSSSGESTSSDSSQIAGVVNINTASASELDSLPGIGPTYAERIIEYRESNGGFSSIDELKNIKGIGDKTFDKLKNSVTI